MFLMSRHSGACRFSFGQLLLGLSLLGITCESRAAFESLSYEVVSGAAGTGVFRIFANFSDSEDELIAIFGNADHQLSLAGNLDPALDESGVTESWLTIGEEPANLNVLYSVGMTDALIALSNGTGFTVNSDAGGMIFTHPGAMEQAMAGEDMKVLIGQFKLNGGQAELSMNLYWKNAMGASVETLDVSLMFPSADVMGCTDLNACNYAELAAIDDGSCTYATGIVDCNGLCLNDTDLDGVCDEDEIEGCTNPVADNFSELATEDDGTCMVQGCTDAAADNFDQTATTDDGGCLFVGCLDVDALNFDLNANSAGECEYAPAGFSGASWEQVGTWEGTPVYRIYIDFTNVNDQLIALFGTSESPLSLSSSDSFLHDEMGNSLAMVTSMDLSDSWVTIGQSSEGEGGLYQAGMESAFANFESGGELLVDSYSGGMWFSSPSEEPNGARTYPVEGRALVGQVITKGQVSCHWNVRCESPSGEQYSEVVDMQFPLGTLGCVDVGACNFDESAELSDGSCEFDSCAGCTLANAVNFDAEATIDDGSCTIEGCTYEEADNYAPEANSDDGSCYFGDVICGLGTVWDEDSETCIWTDTCPTDIDGNGYRGMNDLLLLLASFASFCEVE